MDWIISSYLYYLLSLIIFQNTYGFIFKKFGKQNSVLPFINTIPTPTWKPSENNNNIKLTFTVEIPPGFFEYEKDMNIKSGWKFGMSTPTNGFNYISHGQVNLPRVQVQYAMQSTYNPNALCFYMYFFSTKDKTKTIEQNYKKLY